MKRIIIIGEGQTEQAFCMEVLYPYFLTKDIILDVPTVKHSKGGLVHWQTLKTQIENHLKQDKAAIVSTLIDYYGLHSRHEFPNWQESKNIVDRNDRMTLLEQGMRNEIHDSLRNRFIPYIQLHEFEGLLFNNIETFRNNFTDKEADLTELKSIIDRYPNPELINESKENAPSKRLIKLISGYKKIIDGTALAREIGLPNIRAKSPRFNSWIEILENS